MNVYFCKNSHGNTSDNIAQAQTRFFSYFERQKCLNIRTICGKYILQDQSLSLKMSTEVMYKAKPYINTVK